MPHKATINDAKYILIIGATSGIGRALALAIHDLPSKPTVIIAGRRQDRLDEIVKDVGGERIKSVRFDVNVPQETLKRNVEEVIKAYPELDAVMFSSGIQHIFNFAEPEKIDVSKALDELNVNYGAVFAMITYFTPQLLKIAKTGKPAFIYTITSGLGLLPAPHLSNYSATKAALHSLSLSLTAQLEPHGVYVVEISPPLVESELHDHQGLTPVLSKVWMPLDEFTKLTMAELDKGTEQIPVGTVSEWYNNFDTYNEGKANKLDDVRNFQARIAKKD